MEIRKNIIFIKFKIKYPRVLTLTYTKMQANKIQIITIDNIRYVGKLHNINQEDKSVELRNIQSYGTEDR